MKRAVLVYADDWEGLFINSKLIDEGHTLNEGEERITYFLNLSYEHNFKLEDIAYQFASERYNKRLQEVGSFDMNLEEVDY